MPYSIPNRVIYSNGRLVVGISDIWYSSLKMTIQELKVVTIQKEVDGCMSIFFQKPFDFNFVPGDCFNLFFKEKDFNDGRIFSFSSAPSEDLLRVTFRKGITEYKKRLEEIIPGDILYLKYFGSHYEFYLDRPLIFYAGGIGITVFRSIIREVIDKGLKPDFTLIYSNRSKDFIFKKELDDWARELTMPIHYITTKIEGRLTSEKITQFVPEVREKKYTHYIVGPPAMVDETSDMLQALGVASTTINTDSFDGYPEES